MADELKPCPACGGVAEMKRQGNDYTKKRRIVVRCPACRLERADAAIHHSMEWLEGVATKNWNTRPIEDALRAEVEMRGDQVSALMGQVAQYMAEAQTLRAEVKRLRAYHRAVERIKAWASPFVTCDCACCETCAADVLDIISEEAERGNQG